MNKRMTMALAAVLLMAAGMQAQTVTKSPDGRLTVEVSDANGTPSYSVRLDGDTFIESSPLGLNTTTGDFTKDVKIGNEGEQKTVSDSYSVATIKRSSVKVEANERTISFVDKDGKPAFDLQLHVDNANVAFRYVFRAFNDRRNSMVLNEATAYRINSVATSFNCGQMWPQSGFAATAPSYETSYHFDKPLGEGAGGEGIVFPALFRMGDKGWMMLCETGVSADYCASHLVWKDGQYVIAFPNEREYGDVGTGRPAMARTGELPWRTITVGRTMAPIAETTIMWDLVKPVYEASQEYKYGRATWSWIIRMDSSCNFDEQKEYIDFAAAMGYEYVLIDALWDTQIGYDNVARLSAYAQTKGVGLFMWYNSNGYWNGAPQGPRDKMHRLVNRRKEMAWLKKVGVKGLKIDFIGSDKQQTMQMYEDILADANDFGLMVIYHGCTIPRGWERMYPNFVAAEGVRASENFSFGQDENNREAQSATMHPVLRNAIGNMDFGGSTLNKHYSKDNKRGRIRRTSDVFALATAVLFQTPVQNFALAPNNLTDAPEWAIDFMKRVPTLWQDVRYIDGYPGRYLVMARKSKDGKWYVSAINAQKETLRLKLNLDMIAAGADIDVYSDRVTATDAEGFNTFEGSVKTQKLAKNRRISIEVPKDGAAVIVEK